MLQSLRKMGTVIRISRKMMWAYLLLIFLPTCLFAFFYYERTSDLLEKEVTGSMLQAIRQVEINVSYRLSKIQELSDIMMMNQDLSKYLSETPGETVLDQLQEEEKLLHIVDSIQSNDEIYRVRLYVHNSKIYSSEQVNFFSLEDIQQEDWYREVYGKQGGIVWFPTHRQPYLGDDSGKYVFSCTRIIKDPDNFHHILGLLVLDVPEDLLHRILDQVDFPHATGTAVILDEAGKIVSGGDEAEIGQPLPDGGAFRDIRSSREGVHLIGRGSGRMYEIYETIPAVGWKIVSQIPVRSINRDNLAYTSMNVLMLVSASLLLFLFASFAIFATVTESMVRRVRQITSMVKNEGVEHLDGPTPMKGGAFLQLEKSVQGLLGAMKHYMEEYYSSKAKEREAELRALQAQINPHFLYNTLETINWMAIRRGAGEISAMLNALAKYFRLSLSRGKDVLTVRDELALARVYAEIQQNRFPDSFRCEIDVDEDVLDLPIPKITLQPLIENAILHGIQKRPDKKGAIRIAGRRESEHRFRLSVEDEGVDMPPTQVERIMRWDVRREAGGYGLFNVHERIRLFCGPDCGLSIRSEQGKGTRVDLLLSVRHSRE
jgi:two-component system sensor histidine kinase YesM